MAGFIPLKRVMLKNNKNITTNEDVIKKLIFENPSILGLGELEPIIREKSQPSGGRIDMLLGDEDTRYEVEVQLGPTDESHIIRTLEYWDIEKKRYPTYNHCAVIIAEDITTRFLNVIGLFNGFIPLIALQMEAYEHGDGNLGITFTKILDCMTVGTDEEDVYEPRDRNYWEGKSTPKILAEVDEIFDDLKTYIGSSFEMKYNKVYIGIAKEGVAKNFVVFKPNKSGIILKIDGNNSTVEKELQEKGLDITVKKKKYIVRLHSAKEYKQHKDAIDDLIKAAMSLRSIDLEECSPE